MGNSKKSVFKSALDFDARQLIISREIIAMQNALLAIVKTALPGEIAKHVHYCVPSGNRLLIYTEAASWASQIRFFHKDILNKIAASGQEKITGLQVKIGPQPEQLPKPRAVCLPSAENISLIRQQFQENEESDVLKKALLKLAKTLEKRLKTGRGEVIGGQ